MKLVCWNLHAVPLVGRRVGQRLTAAAAAIEAEAPDVVLLQEIWTAGAFNTIRHLLGDTYLVLVGDRGAGRDCGGLVTCLRRATCQVAEPPVFTRYTDYAPAFKFWQGDGLFKKGVLAVTAVHHASGGRMAVLNTHLQAQYGYYRDPSGALQVRQRYFDERRSQLRELAGIAGHHRELVLIGGDFNSTPDEWPALQLPVAWQDLTEHLQPDAATYLEASGPIAWYDYVFAQPTATTQVHGSARLILNDAVDHPYSDHHGLVIDMTFTERTAAFT